MYLFALSAASHFVPAEPMIMAVGLSICGIAHLLHVFTLGPADFGVKSSGYPANMFVLPLKTRTLTGWPILYGAATFAILWLLVVYLVLIPIGFSPPRFWPAAIAAASAGWVQAISWMPFPTPFARVPALALAVLPLILLGTWGSINFESHTVAAVVTGCSLIWVALAHCFAVLGLARARCGEESTWKLVPETIRAGIARQTALVFNLYRQFPSASAAQVWHECRRNVVFLPAMIAFIGLPLLALNCHAVLNPAANRTLLFGTLSVTPAQMSLGIWIVVPLMLAMSMGQGLGKFDLWGKDTMLSFFAIRPMTTTRYVVIKLIAAAISALVCWTVVWAFLSIWALVEASSLNTKESVVRAAITNLTPRHGAMAIAGLAGLVAVTWRVIATGMWPSLAGRKSVSTGTAVASWGLLVVAAIVGSWIYRHPEVHPWLLSALPWVLGVLLLLKLSAAAGAMYWLHRLRLIERRIVAKSLVVWCAVVVGLFTGLSQWIPPSWLMAAWIVFFVPLARIAVAPLALHMNRHR
jgi:hypothetical protein